jgi:hypothetical protein
MHQRSGVETKGFLRRWRFRWYRQLDYPFSDALRSLPFIRDGAAILNSGFAPAAMRRSLFSDYYI